MGALLLVVVGVLAKVAVGRELSISQFGAVPFSSSVSVAVGNGVALYAALNNATDGDVVVVPAGARFEVIPPHAAARDLVGVGSFLQL